MAVLNRHATLFWAGSRHIQACPLNATAISSRYSRSFHFRPGPRHRYNPHSLRSIVRFRSLHVFITGVPVESRYAQHPSRPADENLYNHEELKNINA